MSTTLPNSSWPVPEPPELTEFIVYRPAPRGRWDTRPARPAVERAPTGPVLATSLEEANAYAKVVWGEQSFCLPKEEASK